MAGGRPKRWNSREALNKDIASYWEYCNENNKPPTIAGLAYYLNCDRQTIYNYAKDDEFFDIIKRARNYIMMCLEEEAIINGKAGTIFVMKQYGYTDKQELDTTVKGDQFIKALSHFTDKL